MPELVDLDIAELSLVERPANKRSPLLLKDDSEEGRAVNELTEILLDTEAENEDDFNDALAKQDVDESTRNALVGAYRLISAHVDQIDEDVAKQVASVALGVDADQPEEDDDVSKWADLPKEARDRMQSLEKRVEKAENDKLRKDMQEVAEEIEALPMEKGELSDLLFRLEQADPDLREDVEQMLKSADEQAQQADAFEEIGKTGGGSDGSDAYTKLEKKAEERVENGDFDTFHKAFRQVCEDNPDLYAEYDAERQ